MIIIEKNEGIKIKYVQTGTIIDFADGGLSINCAAYQKDWAVDLDICYNEDKNLVIGTDSGKLYVAQITIPKREYIYDESNDGEESIEMTVPDPIPLDMENVILSLWSIENM